jgi:hypothetical protein
MFIAFSDAPTTGQSFKTGTGIMVSFHRLRMFRTDSEHFALQSLASISI